MAPPDLKKRNRAEGSIPADFRGYAGEPWSEMEVVFPFDLLYNHLC